MNLKIKQILGILLSILLSLQVLPALAADTILAEGNFDGMTSITEFGTACFPSSIDTKRQGGIDIHSWTEPAEAAEFGTSLKIERTNDQNAFAIFWCGDAVQKIGMDFSAKFANQDSQLNVNLRRDQGDFYAIQFGTDGKINLFGYPMATYESDVWYDFTVQFNAPEKYMLFGMKEHGSSQWTYYDGHHVNTGIGPYSDGTVRVQLEHNFGSVGLVYVDDMTIYSTEDALSPTMNSFSDDFSDGISYADSVIDYARQWKISNQNSGDTVSMGSLSGRDEQAVILKDGSGGSASTYLTISKDIWSTGYIPNLRHNIKFQLGGNFSASFPRIFMDFAPASGSGASKELELLRLQSGNIAVDTNADGSFEDIPGVNIEAGKLYQCEFIYDQATETAIISVVDGDGAAYVNWLDLALFDGAYGLPYSFDVVLYSDGAGEAYFDNFDWSIMQAGSFETAGTAVESGLAEAANMDESAIFKYNQMVDTGEEALAGITVEVKKDGKSVTAPAYTLTAADGGLAVNFTELTKSSHYEVTVSGVQNLFGEAAETATATFTTADFDIVSTNPVISGGTITAGLKGAYGKGCRVYIIAAAYDAAGNIVEVQLSPVTVSSRTEQEASFTPSFTEAHSYFKAMVWRDLTSGIAYTGSVSSN